MGVTIPKPCLLMGTPTGWLQMERVAFGKSPVQLYSKML
jgi:hypothetical protein